MEVTPAAHLIHFQLDMFHCSVATAWHWIFSCSRNSDETAVLFYGFLQKLRARRSFLGMLKSVTRRGETSNPPRVRYGHAEVEKSYFSVDADLYYVAERDGL